MYLRKSFYTVASFFAVFSRAGNIRGSCYISCPCCEPAKAEDHARGQIEIPQKLTDHHPYVPYLLDPVLRSHDCVHFYSRECELIFNCIHTEVCCGSECQSLFLFVMQAFEQLKAEIFFSGMPTSLFNPLIYGLFHVYRPKRGKLGW